MPIKSDAVEFSKLLQRYSHLRSIQATAILENHKKNITKNIMKRRGQLSRPITHIGVGGVIVGVVAGSGLVNGPSTVSSQSVEVEAATQQRVPQTELAAYLGNLNAFSTETEVSEKPRDEILNYSVQGGDTLSTIGAKFGISSETIKWSNDIDDAGSIKPGQILKILPVTGVAHTVQRGDTVYTIGKKYDANPQAIVDFPFNDIGENLSIRIGQILIVPDGTPPEKPRATKAPAKIVTGPSSNDQVPTQKGDGNTKGNFVWPVRGLITQYYASYHKALDIAGDSGTPVIAADGGEVIVSGWVDNSGYGNRIMIRHSNGYVTLYAHLLSGSNKVKTGDKVSQGQVIGARGSTGRSTGSHLHFEIRKGATILNPNTFLK